MSLADPTRHIRGRSHGCLQLVSIRYGRYLLNVSRHTAGDGALASLECDLVRDDDLPRPPLSSGRKEDMLAMSCLKRANLQAPDTIRRDY